MDPDLYIFTSMPEKINTRIKFDKLRNIDIVKDYQLEPFQEKKSLSNKKFIILFIFIFILIIINRKNKKILLVIFIIILLIIFFILMYIGSHESFLDVEPGVITNNSAKK